MAINAQHFGHLLSKVGIALFQVVSHFVRFHLFLVEDLAHCALGEVGEARMSLRGSMLASVAGQKPRCPQFVGIAKFLRLPACQIDTSHALASGVIGWLSTGARAIIQRSQRAFGHGALDAALDRLMMQPECPAPQKTRGLLDRPAISAPAPPGSPVQCATALSISTSPYQLLQATTQAPAATLP